MDEDLILTLATKAMSDTVGPYGLFPSATAIGEFPSLHSYLGANIPRHTLAERKIIAQKARKPMSKHMAAAKIKTALNKSTLAAADRAYQPGDEVLVLREKQIENRKGKYIDPYMIIALDPTRKNVLVQLDEKGNLERYSTAQVKP